MKKICFIVFLLFHIAAIAQEPAPQVIKMQPYDVSVYFGSYSQSTGYSTLADFKKLAPSSGLLTTNLGSYTANSTPTLNAYGMFAMNITIRFPDKKKQEYKSNPQLRAGFIYYKQTLLETSFTREDHKRYDTLTSSQTGEMTFIDSIYHSTYSMRYTTEQVGIDASLIFRTSHTARWSLLAGIGLSVSGPVKAHTEIFHYESKSVSNNPFFYGNNNNVMESELFRNKGGIGASVYFPLGVDMRIGKRRDFWKPLHVYSEVRPGIMMNTIPELPHVIVPAVHFGYGFRYVFGQDVKK